MEFSRVVRCIELIARCPLVQIEEAVGCEPLFRFERRALGRLDELNTRSQNLLDRRTDERIMGASEEDRIDVFRMQRRQIVPYDQLRGRMVGQPLFD